MPIDTNPSGIVPAHLTFLAIYNPTLGGTDEILKDEIVYYYDAQKSNRAGKVTEDLDHDAQWSKEEENKRLRSVGLAKGMIQFSEYASLISVLCTC